MKYKYLSIILVVCSVIYARQPRFILSKSHAENNPVEVLSPEISQVFYGELAGEPQYYRIRSHERFDLYISLLVPDIKGAETDFDVDIYYKDTVIHLHADLFSWQRIFEPFTGDYYLQGPEYENHEVIGTYLFKVCNKKRLGKYSLVIGKIETSRIGKVFSTVKSLPKLKTFLGKSPLTAFFNYTGLFLLAVLLIITLLIYLIAYIIRKIFGPGPRIIRL